MSMGLKEQYNKLLAREKKAEEWLNSPERKPGEVDKFIGEYQKICTELGQLLKEMDKQSIEYSLKDVLEGFNE